MDKGELALLEFLEEGVPVDGFELGWRRPELEPQDTDLFTSMLGSFHAGGNRAALFGPAANRIDQLLSY